MAKAQDCFADLLARMADRLGMGSAYTVAAFSPQHTGGGEYPRGPRRRHDVEPAWASTVATKPFKFVSRSGRHSSGGGYRLSFVKHSRVPLAGFHDVDARGPFAVINRRTIRTR